jgi:hypothetical protein
VSAARGPNVYAPNRRSGDFHPSIQTWAQFATAGLGVSAGAHGTRTDAGPAIDGFGLGLTRLAASIPGLSEVSPAAILAQIGNLRRIATARA